MFQELMSFSGAPWLSPKIQDVAQLCWNQFGQWIIRPTEHGTYNSALSDNDHLSALGYNYE